MDDGDPVYLDYHATSPVDPRVLEEMLPWFSRTFANPGSVTHAAGQAANEEIERCREEIASLIGAARPSEIVFTSGATEANNLALRGVMERLGAGLIVSAATEHQSVLEPLRSLERRGFGATLLPVRPASDPRAGLVDPDHLAEAMRGDTRLVSLMLANNEIGVIQPVSELARICHERGGLFHCDATQAVGKIPVDVGSLDVDLMSFTAHKICGPKGVGALFVRNTGRRVRLEPQISGGGQEFGRRGGTLNVPGIAGLAAALRIACEEREREASRVRRLRDLLWERLQALIPDIQINGPSLEHPELRLPGNLNVRLPGVAGHTVMIHCPGVAMSSGSACTASSGEPSHVLRALGLDEDAVRGSLRLGLGRFTTVNEVERAAGEIAAAVRRLTA